jgi:hypothetical protein
MPNRWKRMIGGLKRRTSPSASFAENPASLTGNRVSQVHRRADHIRNRVTATRSRIDHVRADVYHRM